MRAEARGHPGGWLYVVNGPVDDINTLPRERVFGAWRIDGGGELTSEFRPVDYTTDRRTFGFSRTPVGMDYVRWPLMGIE